MGWLLPGRLAAAALGAGIEARLAPIAINCIDACHNNSAKNMDIGNNNKKNKIEKQIKLLSTASPGWGQRQRPFLDYIRPGVIKEILRPLIGYNQPLPGRGHNCQVRPGAGDFISDIDDVIM